jgi:hypothetical protein
MKRATQPGQQRFIDSKSGVATLGSDLSVAHPKVTPHDHHLRNVRQIINMLMPAPVIVLHI